MDKKGNVLKEPKVYTEQDFAKEYQELCEKTGFRVTVNPAWMARDDGSWSMVLQTSIGPLPKKVDSRA